MSSWSLSSQDEDDALSKMMAFNEDVVLKGHLYMYVDDHVNNPFKYGIITHRNFVLSFQTFLVAT